jgi:hypothetical protein
MRLAALALAFFLPLPVSAAPFVFCDVEITDSIVLVDIGTQRMRLNELDWMMADVSMSKKVISAQYAEDGFEVGILFDRNSGVGLYTINTPDKKPSYAPATCTFQEN